MFAFEFDCHLFTTSEAKRAFVCFLFFIFMIMLRENTLSRLHTLLMEAFTLLELVESPPSVTKVRDPKKSHKF
jgi:hypothetical protein